MMQKSNKPFKTALAAAIAHLKANNVIKSGADVARDLGLDSRSTVSAYANGTTKMSGNFQTLFETKYGLELKNFEHLAEKKLPVEEKKQDPDEQDIKNMYSHQLEFQKIIMRGMEEIKANLNKLTLISSGRFSVSKEEVDYLLSELAKKENINLFPFENLDEKKRKEGNSSDAHS